MHHQLHFGMRAALHHVLGPDLYAAAAALALTVLLTLLAKPLAEFTGLVDRPGGRKAHARPTPVVGGTAILLATVPIGLHLLPLTPPIYALGLAASLILVAGLLDDLIDMRWYWRIGVQAAAALIMIYVGGIRVAHIGPVFGVHDNMLGALSPLFTVLATIGLINAVNMADGVDGLAGSITFAALAMLSAAAIYSGNGRLADGLVLLSGSVAGFLAFNLRTPWNPRAQIFLGNSGSELLGLIIACCAFRLTQNPGHPVAPVLAPFLIALPVIDCLVLTVRRVRSGVSPFRADRNHMHHLMLDAGFSPSATVGAITAASLLIGLCAAIAMRASVAPPWFLAAFLGLTLTYFLLTYSRERSVAALSRLRDFVPSLINSTLGWSAKADGARGHQEVALANGAADLLPSTPSVAVRGTAGPTRRRWRTEATIKQSWTPYSSTQPRAGGSHHAGAPLHAESGGPATPPAAIPSSAGGATPSSPPTIAPRP